jgi:hypothetical protein
MDRRLMKIIKSDAKKLRYFCGSILGAECSGIAISQVLILEKQQRRYKCGKES